MHQHLAIFQLTCSSAGGGPRQVLPLCDHQNGIRDDALPCSKRCRPQAIADSAFSHAVILFFVSVRTAQAVPAGLIEGQAGYRGRKRGSSRGGAAWFHYGGRARLPALGKFQGRDLHRSEGLAAAQPTGVDYPASSTVAVKGVPGRSVYAATRAAVRNLARTWTQELRGRGIRVNVFSPGLIDTPGMRESVGDQAGVEAFKAAISAAVPMESFGQAEEMAEVVAFLASGESS